MMKLKLAITKVGDLLMFSKISKDEQGLSLENVKLSIPDYQRPYKWSATNALQLLEDICEAQNSNKEVYRVGTLILNSHGGDYDIVDGQQRTITFALMLKALGVDVIFLDNYISASSDTVKNLCNNYQVLKRRIGGMLNEGCKKFKDYLCENCELIVIITDDLSEAFQFFDSQNARGKALYPHDLLKAYHLREMEDMPLEVTEKTVAHWESMNQVELAKLFSEYLYRVKEWIKGNRAWGLTEHNIQKFKGIRKRDNFPFAQFYKGALAYAETVNTSSMPFVVGMRNLSPFQIDSPIIAGKPFFDYARHYFNILADIRDNDKYVGCFINDNEIVKTLDAYYSNGVGNGIARLLFDTAILLYVDRFCPDHPSRHDTEQLDRFVILAFVWAYSLRAQYYNLGWQSAQNYILGCGERLVNNCNIYKIIAEAVSPTELFGFLSNIIKPLPKDRIRRRVAWKETRPDENAIRRDYLDHFNSNNFIKE